MIYASRFIATIGAVRLCELRLSESKIEPSVRMPCTPENMIVLENPGPIIKDDFWDNNFKEAYGEK